MKKFPNRKYLLKCKTCPTGFLARNSRKRYCETCSEFEKQKEALLKELKEKFIKSHYFPELEFPKEFYQYKRLNSNHPYIYLID